MIVAGQVEHARVEADVIADALEDDALQVVVEDRAGHALQRGEGLDVAAQEALERLVQGEAGVAGARDQDSTRTKHERRRGAEPTRTVPKLPQSTWPCSPGSVSRWR